MNPEPDDPIKPDDVYISIIIICLASSVAIVINLF